MGLREWHRGGEFLLWDNTRVDGPTAALFDVDQWRTAGRLAGQADGRGVAYFLNATDGARWVLRHNRRGGALSRINHDRYLWTGKARVRAFAEIRMLTALRARGLPVPAPVAARAVKRGTSYRSAVITVYIDHTRPLADALRERTLDERAWQSLGATLAQFHDAGVWHADLNARNVLVDDRQRFHLIDFDKAAIRRPGRWRQANLGRLKRSLDKIARLDSALYFQASDWAALEYGYRVARAADGEEASG